MAKPITVKGLRTEAVFFSDSVKQVVNIESGAVVRAGGYFDGDFFAGVADASSSVKSVFNVDGTIISYFAGLDLVGVGSTAHIGKTGRVEAQFAVLMEGDNQRVVNDGVIRAAYPADATIPASYGLLMDASNGTFVNNGLLIGPDGISVDTEGAKLISNGRKGLIIGEDTAIDIASDLGVATKVVNKGTIQSLAEAGYGIYGGAGAETIVNTGTIIGRVDLREGNDTFNTLKGTMTSIDGTVIIGRQGDDKLITSNAAYQLVEEAAQGFDSVHSTVAYTLTANVELLQLLGKKNIDGVGNAEANFLYGNAGRNSLDGGANGDVLRGFKGTDTLSGGAGADFFVFGTGDGKDTIADFEDGAVDLINLAAWKAIKDFDDLLDHAKDKNGDVVITAGKDSLTIENFTKGALSEAFFSFDPM